MGSRLETMYYRETGDNRGGITFAQHAKKPVRTAVKRQEKHRPASKAGSQNTAFPDISIVRRFDKSRATDEWFEFEDALAVASEKMGIAALTLSDLKLVLISPTEINKAMTERYSNIAQGKSDKRRRMLASDTLDIISDFVVTTNENHERSFAELTHGESANSCPTALYPESPNYTSLFQDGLELELRSYYGDDSYATTGKENAAWRPHAAMITQHVATGPQSYGALVEDSMGVYASEIRELVGGMSRELGFNPKYFARSLVAPRTMTLVDSPAFYDRTTEILIPACPIDVPLGVPSAVWSGDYE